MMKQLSVSIVALFIVGFVCSVESFAEPLTLSLVKQKVNEACQLLEKEGEAAFDTLRDPKGSFRFANGDGYIWLQNLDAKILMHPVNPTLVGKDLSGLTDKDGVPFILMFSEICADKGSGWVPYQWPKPGEKESSPKIAYVKAVKHGEKEFVAGAGMYDATLADVKAAFPGDPVFEE